jgi:integrase
MKTSSIASIYPRGGAYEVAVDLRSLGGRRETRRVATPIEGEAWALERRAALLRGEMLVARSARLRVRLTDEEIIRRLAATTYAETTHDHLRGAGRWVRANCDDLLDAPVEDLRALKRTLAEILARRAQPSRDLRSASPLLGLVGSWRRVGAHLERDGQPVLLHSTAPQQIVLAPGVDAACVDLTDAPAAAAALAHLAEEGRPLSAHALGGQWILETLRRRGLVVVRRGTQRDTRAAIEALLNGPQREADLGIEAARTLLRRGWATRLDPAVYAARRGASKSVRTALRSLLALAVDEEGGVALLPRLTGRTPREGVSRLARATAPGHEVPDAATLIALAATLINAARAGDALDRILALEALLGLRQGEARGLRVGDLDRTAGILAVRRAYTREGRHAAYRATKTRTSSRRIALDADLLALLTAWTTGRDDAAPLVGALPSNTRLQTRLAVRCAEAGLTGRIFATDLRHLAATIAAESGVPIDEIARDLGHGARLSTTLRHYIERTSAPSGGSVARAVLRAARGA